MSLTGPPLLRQVHKPSTVLAGGRTRLQVSLAGWGRVTFTHLTPEGEVMRRRRWLFGGERELSVDVLPPCEVTIRVANVFGADSATVTVRADAAGVADLPSPRAQPLVPTAVHPTVGAVHRASPQVRIAVRPLVAAPYIRPGALAPPHPASSKDPSGGERHD